MPKNGGIGRKEKCSFPFLSHSHFLPFLFKHISNNYHQENLVWQVDLLKETRVQSAIKEGVLDDLMLRRIIMKLE